MTRLNLNSDNSKVIGDKVFITALKAHKAMEGVNHKNSIIHPTLGRMYEYNGVYARFSNLRSGRLDEQIFNKHKC
jgi:hypothetical protein